MLNVSDRETKKTYKYSISLDGTLSDKRIFADVGSDGMTLDEKGNFYVTTDAVHVFNPSRGNRRFLLFISALTDFYSVDMSVAGMSWPTR